MAIGGPGTINGREINWFAINAGTVGGGVIKDLAANMSIAFSQVAALGKRMTLEPYGIMTFDSALALTRVQLLETAGDIELDMGVDIYVNPALGARHVIAFGMQAGLGHAFFSHWLDQTRMTLPADDRAIMVRRENRRIIVPPDPDELVEQKHLEVVA